MKELLLCCSLALCLLACDNTTSVIDQPDHSAIVPIPSEGVFDSQALVFSAQSQIYAEGPELRPLINLFVEELKSVTGLSLSIAENQGTHVDLIFAIDTELAADEYKISVTDKIAVSGGSYQALAMARSTLHQLAFDHEGSLAFPIMSISDTPTTKYRGLMIDLARQWHTVETIKSLIDLASYYKSNYVHLHFTDYQSYTLPSRKYTKLPTEGRSYSFQDLEVLEAYAQLRGITLIPEIDIPGHASSIVKAYPEIFGLKDIDENPWTINMGKEEVYEALETIISEIIPIFNQALISTLVAMKPFFIR
ncbi:MAG: family 20 glycosylhydrolase [Roseivirga sp.]|nr:family 20 glycosylhydrolase [Roseivirga sp.]